MLVIGLTGGAAAGKTLVAGRFAALDVPVADADAVSREVVAPGTEGLDAVVKVFGTGVLAADGTLDRAAMRERILADAADRQALEQILHPRIRALMDERTRAWREAGHPYGIEVVPLLVETGGYARCDRVLVVDAPEDVQLARLQARDGIDAEKARALLAAQAPRWERLRHADDVVANGDAVPAATGVDCQVQALDRKYRALATR